MQHRIKRCRYRTGLQDRPCQISGGAKIQTVHFQLQKLLHFHPHNLTIMKNLSQGFCELADCHCDLEVEWMEAQQTLQLMIRCLNFGIASNLAIYPTTADIAVES